MSYHIIRIDELGERHEIVVSGPDLQPMKLDRSQAEDYVTMLELYGPSYERYELVEEKGNEEC